MATKMAKMATDMAKRHGQMVLDASYEAAANAPDCNKNNNNKNSNNNNSFEQEQVAWHRIRDASLPCLRRRRRWRQRLDQRLLMPQNDVISKKRTVITSWRSRRWLRFAVALPHGNLLDADVADDCSRLHSSYQPAGLPLPLSLYSPTSPRSLSSWWWWRDVRDFVDARLAAKLINYYYILLFLFFLCCSFSELSCQLWRSTIFCLYFVYYYSLQFFLAKSLCDWN